MELLGGHTLEHRLAVGPLPPRAGLRVCAEVASALAAAHAQGLVHRDIKPGNVMLTPTGAKVLDFGIAAAVGEPEIDFEGRLLGTPAYLAPERLRPARCCRPATCTPSACCCYRVLTGRLPWPPRRRPGCSARTRTSSRTRCPRSTAYRPRSTGSTAGAWPATPPTGRRPPTRPASCSPPPAQPSPEAAAVAAEPAAAVAEPTSPSRPAPSRPVPSRPVPTDQAGSAEPTGQRRADRAIGRADETRAVASGSSHPGGRRRGDRRGGAGRVARRLRQSSTGAERRADRHGARAPPRWGCPAPRSRPTRSTTRPSAVPPTRKTAPATRTGPPTGPGGTVAPGPTPTTRGPTPTTPPGADSHRCRRCTRRRARRDGHRSLRGKVGRGARGGARARFPGRGYDPGPAKQHRGRADLRASTAARSGCSAPTAS